jgi:branched-chain amino acid transport system ATP-binding protein
VSEPPVLDRTPPTRDDPPARLVVDIDAAGYGHRTVIQDVHFSVARGTICTLLGRNGAGKSSVLLTCAGFIGERTSAVQLDGRPLTGPPYARARQGLTTVLKGRSLFASLTVAENFEMGGVTVEEAVELFPELSNRLGVQAGVLSGGEQQMVTVARGLLRRPAAILIDELTFGLSPAVTDRLLDALVSKVAEFDIAAVVVEQHLHFAQAVADEAIVMGEGRLRLRVSAKELAAREEEIERVYLGRPQQDAT